MAEPMELDDARRGATRLLVLPLGLFPAGLLIFWLLGQAADYAAWIWEPPMILCPAAALLMMASPVTWLAYAFNWWGVRKWTGEAEAGRQAALARAMGEKRGAKRGAKQVSIGGKVYDLPITIFHTFYDPDEDCDMQAEVFYAEDGSAVVKSVQYDFHGDPRPWAKRDEWSRRNKRHLYSWREGREYTLAEVNDRWGIA
jgi:hypothetical protein